MLDLFENIIIKEYSVSEITQNIKKLLEGELQYIKVHGEISDYKKSPQGHIYFFLKDENAMIAIVFFKQYADYLKFKLENGIKITVSGKITIYQQRSTYQLIAEEIKVNGEGELLKLIEKRKIKLEKEGLFDISRKKSIPEFIEKVGIITSPTGAAIYDIKSRLTAKIPINIFLYPACVQGITAPKEIIKGIRYFNKLSKKNRPDVIVITRGGGSIEDLMCFNDEELVRIVAKSKIPIISAVGHEIDYTLIDYVSDLRLPTPTSVAEIISKSKYEILNKIDSVFEKITKLVNDQFDSFNETFSKLNEKIKSHILYIVEKENAFALLDKLFIGNLKNFWQTKYLAYVERIDKINFEKVYQNIEILENNLDWLSKKLELYNYKNVLAKGYAVLKKNGIFIKDFNSIQTNEEYTLEFEYGSKKIKILD
jgi:exodeoxyribonuclease VII large subunit